MNKKGFTLVELLVTISIIISLTAIVIVGVVSISNRSKEQAYEEVKEQIMTAAEQYFDANEYMFEGLGGDTYGVITVGMLVQEDYLNKVTDPRTGESVNPCSQVQVSRKDGRYVSEFKEYENGMKCNNDNFIALAEPGAPSIEASFYKNIFRTTDGNTLNYKALPNNNGWFNIETLSYDDDNLENPGKLRVQVTIKTEGNGEIESLKGCESDSSNCTSFGSDLEYNSTSSYGEVVPGSYTYWDTETYNLDTDGTYSCYEVTNISGKSARTCVYAKVDTQAPTVTLAVKGYAKKVGATVENYTGSGKWYTRNVSVLINDMSSDVEEWSWKTDSGWSSGKLEPEDLFTEDVKKNLYISDDGKNRTVTVNLVDKAGNENTENIKNINIDKTVPTCTVTISGNNKNGEEYKDNGWYTSAVTLTGKCSDNTSGCINKNVEYKYTTETAKIAKSPGAVFDNAGNSTNCASKTFGIDWTAPTIAKTGHGSVTCLGNNDKDLNYGFSAEFYDNLTKVKATYKYHSCNTDFGGILNSVESPSKDSYKVSDFVSCASNQLGFIYYFTDLAGNTSTYEFNIPKGTGYYHTGAKCHCNGVNKWYDNANNQNISCE